MLIGQSDSEIAYFDGINQQTRSDKKKTNFKPNVTGFLQCLFSKNNPAVKKPHENTPQHWNTTELQKMQKTG